MKPININKYWYHSLCSPYDDRYFSGMVQKKCASSQELCMGPKQFFFKQKRLLNQGPSSSGSQMQLQSGFLLWNSPGANSISQPQQENIPEKRRYQLVTCDVGWNSNLNISMAASKGLSFEPSISCHLTETSPSGICSISATWK